MPGLRGLPQLERIPALNDFKLSRPDLVAEYDAAILTVDSQRKVLLSGPYSGIGSGGDPDLFQAFAWRNWQLICDKGLLGVVMPRGALSGASLQNWRRKVLDNGSFPSVVFMANSNEWIFQNVHSQYTVAAIAIRKGDKSDICFAGPFHDENEFLAGQLDLVNVGVDEFLSWSETAAFPTIPNKLAGEIVKQMRKSPKFGDTDPDWEYRPYTELHASGDKKLFEFDVSESKNRTPVLAGASFNIWNPNFGDPFAYSPTRKLEEHLLAKLRTASSNKRSAYFGFDIKDKQDLPLTSPRIAFRDVTNSVDSRTMICCLIPAQTAATHMAPLLVRRAGDTRTDAFLLGVLSSMIFDWYARRWITLHFTFEMLNPMPVPRPNLSGALASRVIEISGRLAAVDDRYSEWASQLNISVGTVADEETSNALVAELDAVVAILYGLDESQIKHIFNTFRKSWSYDQHLDSVLNHFHNWKDKK